MRRKAEAEAAVAIFQTLEMQKSRDASAVLVLFQIETQKSHRGYRDSLLHSCCACSRRRTLQQTALLSCWEPLIYWDRMLIIMGSMKRLVVFFFLNEQCSPINFGFVMDAEKILRNYQRNWFGDFRCAYVQHNFTVSLFAIKRDIDDVGAGFPLEAFT